MLGLCRYCHTAEHHKRGAKGRTGENTSRRRISKTKQEIKKSKG